MSNLCRRMQFGSNDLRVPGHERDDNQDNHPDVIVEPMLPDPDRSLWDLAFTYEAGAFYLPGTSVPALDGEVVTSWYMKEGTGPGQPHLTFCPFLNGQFIHFNCVDFNVKTVSPNVAPTTNTDPKVSTITGTVHAEIPELMDVKTTVSSTLNGPIIKMTVTTTTTRVVFDRIVVLYGAYQQLGTNGLAVNEGGNCLALAVFKEEVSSTTETSSATVPQYKPHIDPREWGVILAEAIKHGLEDPHVIAGHLTMGTAAEAGPEALHKLVTDINRRIDQLGEIKGVISRVAEKKG